MSKIEKKTPAPDQKKRAVISYENMQPELLAAFKEVYPRGYADYMGDILKVDKPDGTFFYAVPLEVPDAIYLVKITVKVDDYDEAENGIFNEDVPNEDDNGGDDVFPEEGTENTFNAEEEQEED